MNILYVKRAYNTRLHTQIHALSEPGTFHRSPAGGSRSSGGYSGPGQWDDSGRSGPAFPLSTRHPGPARPGALSEQA